MPQAESFNPRTLFLFGSYTIGKERLFLHVAAALKAKIYVAAAKRAVLGAIKLPPEHAALLTTNHLEANIHVVSTRQNLIAGGDLLQALCCTVSALHCATCHGHWSR